MKKLILLVLLSVVFIPAGISQNTGHVEGGAYSKKTSYNLIGQGDKLYNLSDKSVLDRVLFGMTNSFVEYVFKGPFDNSEVLALRIVADEQTGSYRLDIMKMQNMDNVSKMIRDLEAETGEINIPGKLQAQLSPQILEKIREHNKDAFYNALHSDEPYKQYRPEAKTFNISKELAEKLHGKIASLIQNFTGKGNQAIIADGNTMTFRCVTGDEVHSLSVHCPQNAANLLSDACIDIINSYEKNPDNTRYIELLDKIDL